VVFHADAIIYPGAVVVKALDTGVADGAVAGAGSADSFAVGAELG